jgi:hypothetical protein
VDSLGGEACEQDPPHCLHVGGSLVPG